MRRGGRIARRGGGMPAAPATLIGISGFVSSANFYQGNAGEGPPGYAQSTSWVLVRDSGSGSGVLVGRAANLAATSGWCIVSTSTLVRGRVGDGAAVITTPNYTWAGADIGAWTVFHLVIDVAGGRAKFFRNGIEIGAPGTAITAYAADASSRPTVGCRTSGGDAFTRGDIGGCGQVDVALTAGQVAAHYAAIVAAGRSVLPGLGTNTWNYHSADADATWSYTGTGSNGVMTRTGALTYTPRPLIWST